MLWDVLRIYLLQHVVLFATNISLSIISAVCYKYYSDNICIPFFSCYISCQVLTLCILPFCFLICLHAITIPIVIGHQFDSWYFTYCFIQFSHPTRSFIRNADELLSSACHICASSTEPPINSIRLSWAVTLQFRNETCSNRQIIRIPQKTLNPLHRQVWKEMVSLQKSGYESNECLHDNYEVNWSS